MATNNKIQVIYRLENLVTLCWPVRPNDSVTVVPEKYNLYWSDSLTGTFTFLGSVENVSSSSRSYLKKVVYNVVPSVIGWNNNIVNYIKLRPVVSGIEQSFEDPISIEPYSYGNMRFKYPLIDKTIVVGYNSDENRLVPISVDKDGKVKTI